MPTVPIAVTNPGIDSGKTPWFDTWATKNPIKLLIKGVVCPSIFL